MVSFIKIVIKETACNASLVKLSFKFIWAALTLVFECVCFSFQAMKANGRTMSSAQMWQRYSFFFLFSFLIYQLLSPNKRTNSSWSVYAIITNLTKRVWVCFVWKENAFLSFSTAATGYNTEGIKHSHSEMSQLFISITGWRRIGVAGCFHILGPQWETVIPPLWQERTPKDP